MYNVRPVVLATLSLVAGIFAADRLFYEASVTVPRLLGPCLWGFCCLIALIVLWLYRRPAKLFASHTAFTVLTALFFVVIGFARYAAEAEAIQTSWQAMRYPPVNRGNPDEFDYRRWRWVQGVGVDSTTIFGRARNKAQTVRLRLVKRYAQAHLADEAMGIIVASTLGDRSMIDRDTRDLYAAAGAAHLLALSGLHLGIIVGWLLMWMNGRLLLSRWRRWVGLAVLLLIWTFAFVAGLPTSLVRASMMTSVFITAALLQRHGNTLHLLWLTVLLMLLLNPLYLFDVGAQLSVASVAGILFLHHRMVEWIVARWRFIWFRLERYHLTGPLLMFSVSLSAQLFSLPLVMAYFHRVSPYSTLFNLFYIPVTTIILYGSLLLLVVTGLSILSWLVPLMSRGLSWLVAAQLAVMQFEVSLPGAVIDDCWSRRAEPQVVVYHNRRCPALHVIGAPDQSWLLMPQPDSLQVGMRFIAESFWRRRLTAEPTVLDGHHSVVAGAFSAVMIDEPLSPMWTSLPSSPQEITLLWLTTGFRGSSLGDLPARYTPRLLVLDASLPRWQREALADEAASVGWPVYDIAQQGALRFMLETRVKSEK